MKDTLLKLANYINFGTFLMGLENFKFRAWLPLKAPVRWLDLCWDDFSDCFSLSQAEAPALSTCLEGGKMVSVSPPHSIPCSFKGAVFCTLPLPAMTSVLCLVDGLLLGVLSPGVQRAEAWMSGTARLTRLGDRWWNWLMFSRRCCLKKHPAV